MTLMKTLWPETKVLPGTFIFDKFYANYPGGP